MRRFLVLSAAVLTLLVTAACANMTPTEQRALSGGAFGAAGGAALSAIAGGNPAIGAAVGGGAGVVAGALWKDIQNALQEK